jgi:hypothetical protein
VKVEIGGVTFELTPGQVESLCLQLGAGRGCNRIHGVSRQLGDPVLERRRQGGDSPRLLDAATVAQRLGVSREYVYSHARELGGRKLGNGPKAPWRFDPAGLVQDDLGAVPHQTSSKPPPKPKRNARRRGGGDDLLEIRGERPYAA